MNERIVEDFVYEELKNLGYINIEKQSSKNSLIQQALNKASKSGKGNSGRPEFIVQFPNAPDVVMIIECKADTKKHQSANLSDPVNYAVDGVLHYASFLTKNFKVIALAVSGENEKKLSSFIVTEKASKELKLNKIMDEVYYTNQVAQELRGEMLETANLLNYAKTIHNYLRDFAKLSETEKPLIVGGALIALYDRTFRESYNTIPTPQRLASETVRAIQQVLEDSSIDSDKINSIIQPYSFIAVHPELTKNDTLVTFLKMLENNVYHSTYSSIDMVGEFYKEFLRYTGGDKKGLGIVLTPTHVTELFCKLANLTVNSVVVDPCCGTGGFLISAMHDMLLQAGDDTDLQKKIKQNNLIGIEQSPNMFALACSNMILRGDGKANLKMGSCFGFRDSIKSHRPTVGMINPPYSQKGDGLSEMDFVKFMLECLEPNGTGIAIVPMSCAISNSTAKEEILKSHTLEAVMTMPSELFYPVGTNTCIMVFTAHKPHDVSRNTWFGMWKDDGFIKTKTNGRIPKDDWNQVLDNWISTYKNRESIPGYSVNHAVNANDEWCAEAYLETDVSKIDVNAYISVIKEYTLYQLSINNEN